MDPTKTISTQPKQFVWSKIILDLYIEGQGTSPLYRASIDPLINYLASEDIKSHDIKIDDIEVPTSTSVWSFLVKRSRYLYQVEHGRTQICPEVQTKLTITLLREMQQLLK